MTRRSIGMGALAVGTIALPFVANAQTITSILGLFSSFINIAIYLLISLAILAFFVGLVSYIFKAGEEKSKGLNIMMYGILAIFVMVSVWGLVRLLQNTFGVTSTAPIVPQTIQVNTI